MQLQHGVLHLQYPLQHRLVWTCIRSADIEPHNRVRTEALTELLYCTSMRMRCDRCFDSFCMILAKLIVEKKLRHENSVYRSTSSTCFCPFGRVVVRTVVCRDARCM